MSAALTRVVPLSDVDNSAIFAIPHRDSRGEDCIVVYYGLSFAVVPLRTLNVRRVARPHEYEVLSAVSVIGTDECMLVGPSGVVLFNVHTLAFRRIRALPALAQSYKAYNYSRFILIICTQFTRQSTRHFNPFHQRTFVTMFVYDPSTGTFVFEHATKTENTRLDLIENMRVNDGIIFRDYSKQYHGPGWTVKLSFATWTFENIPTPTQNEAYEFARRYKSEMFVWPPGAYKPSINVVDDFYLRRVSLFLNNELIMRADYENDDDVYGMVDFFYMPENHRVYVVYVRKLYVYDVLPAPNAALLAALGHPTFSYFFRRIDGDHAVAWGVIGFLPHSSGGGGDN